MKIPPKEFFSLIREMIRDEIKKSLPRMIERVLTEQYVRKIISEGSGQDEPAPVRQPARAPSAARDRLREAVMGEDAPAPEPPRRHVANPQLLRDDNPLAVMYEGTKPLAAETPPEVPEEAIAALGLDFAKMRSMIGADRPGPMQETDQQKERELARRRAALEVKPT